MYRSAKPSDSLLEAPDDAPVPPRLRRNVWILGVTSLLTDASTEMVAAVLPLYAMYFLRLSPMAFGAVDAVQQGGASIIKLLSGWFTDRSAKYLPVAAAGYACSTVSRLGLVLGGSFAWLLTPLVMVDRIGKGIRTAPRDAIISLSVTKATLGRAFGVHRALDTAGALLGPLIAFAVLRWIRNGYDVIFVISLALSALAVAVFVTFAQSPPQLNRPAATRVAPASPWPTHFARIPISAALLGLATVSDSFIYLSIQQRAGFSPEYVPLLFVLTPAVYLSLAAPFGRLADRVGRIVVIVGGYAAMMAIYLALRSALPAMALVAVIVVLLGAFYAATDGVFAALASAELPVDRRASGLALVSAGNDLGRMVASVIFGWQWSRGATHTAIIPFQIGLPIMVMIVIFLLSPRLTTATRHD